MDNGLFFVILRPKSTVMEKINVAIFVSGGGTNCENLIKYFKGSELVNTALVVSNKPDAYALVRAERLEVPTAVVQGRPAQSRCNDAAT